MMQHLTEVVTEPGLITAGTVAHRRTTTPKNPDDRRAYDGTPTSPWPACQKKPAKIPAGSWRETSAGRAQELGAVPCTAKACYTAPSN